MTKQTEKKLTAEQHHVLREKGTEPNYRKTTLTVCAASKFSAKSAAVI
ncbi:hypothetical protein HZA99_02060 [Candidatus Woesearchaeota archaeon]|nr:hypothetical protein [Candidatus Woesearchaeota archaeon]